MTQKDKEQECKKCGRVFCSVRCFDVDCPNNTPKTNINQEHKEILLKDICGRLPYGVKCAEAYPDSKFINKWDVLAIDGTYGNEFSQVCISNCEKTYGYKTSIENVKPYLFPLSSMNEEQRNEFLNIQSEDRKRLLDALLKYKYEEEDKLPIIPLQKHIDWLNKNHFDYRGLIPMGLAIDATNLNVY